MAEARLRLALDANVLIAGTYLPRWPYEVLRVASRGTYDVLLPAQVLGEARRHLHTPEHLRAFEDFLSACSYEIVPEPSTERIDANLDLVRDRTDVGLALALLDAGADILVTHDKDFTEPGATSLRFAQRVRVLLPAVFLRQVVGWSSEALEAIRHRGWEDLPTEAQPEDIAP